MERIQKIIAASGVCSRRAAENLITEGRVYINGHKVELGQSANPTDAITVNGRRLPRVQTITYLLNKPKGYVCSNARQGNEKLVTELVPTYPPVHSIGRLDRESEGLLLLTNDGALSQRLAHPSHGHTKEYRVIASWQHDEPRLPEWVDMKLLHGVKLGDGMARATNAHSTVLADGRLLIKISLQEGRNHLVRRMCATIGLDVASLRRTKFATLTLSNLHPGAWRPLTPKELLALA
jgi:23S rRNA pseudouridine2605 synthase